MKIVILLIFIFNSILLIASGTCHVDFKYEPLKEQKGSVLYISKNYDYYILPNELDLIDSVLMTSGKTYSSNIQIDKFEILYLIVIPSGENSQIFLSPDDSLEIEIKETENHYFQFN